jgi:hypothetical protein
MTGAAFLTTKLFIIVVVLIIILNLKVCYGTALPWI